MIIITDVFVDLPSFGGQPLIWTRGDAVTFYDSVTFIGPAGDIIKRGHLSLDRAIFVNCTFKNTVLWYGGGSVYFSSTNKVVDSELAFGEPAFDIPDWARQLQASFDLATKNSGRLPNTTH